MTVIVHVLQASAWTRLPRVEHLDVRPADEDDHVALNALVSACRGQGGFCHALSLKALGGAAPVAHRRASTLLVEGADGDVVGAAGLSAVATAGGCRWSIPFLLVVPAARRRGVATALVRELLRASVAAGANEVSAETLASWIDAAAFWDRLARTLADAPEDGRTGDHRPV